MSKIETHLHTAECDKCAHVSAKDIVHLYKGYSRSGRDGIEAS